MQREGWIYTIAFATIVAVGAFVILPRLSRGPAREPAIPAATTPDPVAAAPAVPATVPKPEAEAPAPWVEITVGGEGGMLRGPLKAVHGAELEAAPDAPEEVRRSLRLRATAARVAFGAMGHQWVSVPAGALRDGLHISLPESAPSLVVRVREADGRAAVDVPVRVLPEAPGPLRRTDAGGTLVLDDLAPGLVVIDLTTPERSGPRVQLVAGEDKSARLVLEPAWAVVGRVTTPQGDPVAGARVEGFGMRGPLGRAAPSGADGRFTWRGPAAVPLALRFTADGWAEEAIKVVPPATGPLRTDVGGVALRTPGVSLEGRVVAARLGRDAHVLVEPTVAAHVREQFGAAQVLDRARRVPIALDGTYRLDNLPAAAPLRVSIRGAGLPADVLAHGTPGQRLALETTIEPGETLAGMVTHPGGEPAGGVRLLLSREPREGNLRLPDDVEVHTGPDGAFHVHGLRPREHFLRAYVPGRRSLLARVELPRTDAVLLELEAALTDASRRVEGIVTDEKGAPLAGVTVRAAGVQGFTDAQGAFRLDGVEGLAPLVRLAYGFEPGPLPPGASDPRGRVARQVVDVKPGTGRALKLVLPLATAVRFRAVDGIDDTPIAHAHVIVLARGGRIVFDRVVATHDGRVELTGLPGGGLSVAALAPDRRYRADLPLAAGQSKDLGDVLLVHGMRVRGTVRGPGDVPVAGARVAAMDRGWQSRGTQPILERELLFRTAVTDAAGTYAIAGFDPKAAADVVVWAEGYAPVSRNVDLPPFSDDVEATLDVVLGEGGFLSLVLEDEATKAPLVGAMMDLETREGADYLDQIHRGALGGPIGSTAEWRIASERLLFEQEEGQYVVGPLEPGPYEIWIERPGYEPLRRGLSVLSKDQNVFRGTEAMVRVGSVGGNVTRLIFSLRRGAAER